MFCVTYAAAAALFTDRRLSNNETGNRRRRRRSRVSVSEQLEFAISLDCVAWETNLALKHTDTANRSTAMIVLHHHST